VLPETVDEPTVAAAAIDPGPPAETPAETPPAPEQDPPEPAVRYCENCGAERRPGGRFCTNCGQA
jgi:hypothetical protein